jgi:integrase
VCLGTGCRVGELLGLRWCDIDFKAGTISINHTMTYKTRKNGKYEPHISTPKTQAGCRTIPMIQEVKKAFISEKAAQLRNGGCRAEIDGYSDFVFTTSTGNIQYNAEISDAIQRITAAYNAQEIEKAEKEHREPLIIPHFSVHNLRHTFCTRFCENETNIKVIQEVMGHSNISTTMNIYAEATEEKKKNALKNLEGKIKIS